MQDPNVEGNVQLGHIDRTILIDLADVVVTQSNAAALLKQVNVFHKVTSILGFQDFISQIKIKIYIIPFYAGYALTTERAPITIKRSQGISFPNRVYATLIAYPQYFNPNQINHAKFKFHNLVFQAFIFPITFL